MDYHLLKRFLSLFRLIPAGIWAFDIGAVFVLKGVIFPALEKYHNLADGLVAVGADSRKLGRGIHPPNSRPVGDWE